MDLSDKRILVTGASRGLGRAIAIGLAQHDTQIAIVARDGDALRATAERIGNAGGQPLEITADLGSIEDCQRIWNTCDREFGGVDILINNVGIWEGKKFQDVELQEIGKIIDVNLRGTIVLTHLVMRGMQQQHRGHIITIGSTVGLYCASYSTVYAATKFGVWGFCRSIRPSCREYNIKVTTIFPGSIASDLDVDVDTEAVREKYGGKRMPTADIVQLLRSVLTMSDMSLVEEVAIPAMKDHYGD